MTARDLPELIAQWRERISADRHDTYHDALRDAYEVCADELEAALAGAGAVHQARDAYGAWRDCTAAEAERTLYPAPVAVCVDEAWRTDLPAMDQSDGGNPPLFSSKLVLVSLADGEVTTDRSMRFPSNPDDKPFWFVYGKKVLAWRPMPEPFTAALEAKPHA
jgi:hypothetical protein